MKFAVLFSGGLDSTVLLHHTLRSVEAKNIVAVSVRYNQPHESELIFAKQTCDDLGIEHVIVNSHPWNRTPNPVRVNDIPWSPKAGDPMVIRGRNSLFVCLAYIVTECSEIHLGCNADDQHDYPDCRESWSRAMSQALNIRVCLPLRLWSKKEIVKMSKLYKIDLDKTLSCYMGKTPGCGACAACVLRDEAMR